MLYSLLPEKWRRVVVFFNLCILVIAHTLTKREMTWQVSLKKKKAKSENTPKLFLCLHLNLLFSVMLL